MEECVVRGGQLYSPAQLGLLSSYNLLITAAMLIIFFLHPVSRGFQIGMYVPCKKQIHP